MKYKIVLHKSKYFSEYREFCQNLTKIHKKKLDIHHIGSTSVSGLDGKGVIDVLIGVKNWRESEGVIKSLKGIGIKYCWPKNGGRIFLSNRKINSREGDFHIHLVRRATKQYKNFIRFRDILRQDESIAKKYKKIKVRAIKTSENRFFYKHFKGFFIESVLKKELCLNYLV
ncbi:MAG: GrpB family protein [Candidatus Berkelbacteria bacterium]|nr:GrpB family protein [Candidatus Berkelbacteria bacterium]